ncbi:hypothetical protein SAL_0948 [Streptococcus agalactiae 515]|nr:hypothetical protein SAL_0948 [Streptococcus agalactiae 515]
MKILINNSLEISASNGIPVAIYSCKVWVRSIEIKAPILRGLI